MKLNRKKTQGYRENFVIVQKRNRIVTQVEQITRVQNVRVFTFSFKKFQKINSQQK